MSTAGHDSKEDAWEYLGKSPVKNVRIPGGPDGYWKFNKPGYEEVERTDASVLDEGNSGVVLSVDLMKKGTAPAGMVRVASGKLPVTLFFPGYEDLPEVRLDDFWLDKYEVTNKAYREFVRRGGYEKREYWKNAFIKDGSTLGWNKAMLMFGDATGEPGPAGWVQREYPAGQDDFPVTGVSWYEAAAYAEFCGKALPTLYHWGLAAKTYTSAYVIPLSNFEGKGAARVGAYRGMNPYGSYDMAGNVKEWCWNEAVFAKRYILGGAWNEPVYQFTEVDARSPFDRDSTFGFRCVKYLSPVPKTLLDPVKRSARDYNREKPVSDQVFQAFRSLYSYDKNSASGRSRVRDG
jgi:eukaryotic-like serine/threonine-protein kinase